MEARRGGARGGEHAAARAAVASGAQAGRRFCRDNQRQTQSAVIAGGDAAGVGLRHRGLQRGHGVPVIACN